MSESFQVETYDIGISDALLEIGRKNGWDSRKLAGTIRPWLVLYPQAGDFSWSGCSQLKRHTTISIPEAIELLRKKPEPEPILVGTNPVEFHNNGVVIPAAGLFILTEAIDAMQKRLHEKD